MPEEKIFSRRRFVKVAAGLPASLAIDGRLVGQTEPQPFASAIGVWHMGDAAPGQPGIRVEGEVRLGVALQGAEREESIGRGGDGKVAEFRDGYLVLGEDRSLDLSGKKQMTICLRVRDPQDRCYTPLLSLAVAQNKVNAVIHPAGTNLRHLNYQASRRLRHGTALEFVWRTAPIEQQVKPEYLQYELSHQYLRNEDFVDGVLRLQAPVELIGADRWRDVIVRFNSANLELFIDGVLVDEEWPYGALHNFRGPFLLGAGYRDGRLQSGFRGQVDHVAFWDRPLTNSEIASLSGGEAEIARRTGEFLGPEQTSLQYWRPRGFNTYVGDTMPEFYNGEFHLHYLFDRRHHGSKWGMGAHQFAHASSKDLVHWTHHPLTVKVTEQHEPSIGTGEVVFHEGKYHAYYIQHQRRCWFKDAPYNGDTIHEATSADGVRFDKDRKPLVPWVYMRRKDGSPGDINPDIYPDASGRNFYMSLSGEKIWVSPDFENWKEAEGFDLYKDIGKGICSSYFQWNGWHYLWSNGTYRMSREPLQPGWQWTQVEDPATHEGLSVPKVAAFHDNRYLVAGFLGGSAYAGEVVFRELLQHADGTLGTKWPAEMIPSTGAALNAPFQPLTGSAVYGAQGLSMNATSGRSAGMFLGVPQDVRIRLGIRPGLGISAFGLCARGEGAYERGCEIRFEPKEQRVQCGPPGNRGMEIRRVTGLDQPFQLDVLVKDDFVDCCIDDRRTFISRRPDRPQGDRLFLFADGGEVLFESIGIRPLL